jgi:hypothetical protein
MAPVIASVEVPVLRSSLLRRMELRLDRDHTPLGPAWGGFFPAGAMRANEVSYKMTNDS